MKNNFKKNITMFLIMFFTLGLCKAKAMQISFETADKCARQGETASVVCCVNCQNIQEIPDTFTAKINFDSSKLSYKKINCTEDVPRKNINCEKSDCGLNLFFKKSKNFKPTLQDNHSELFEIVFNVKAKSTLGETPVQIFFEIENNKFSQILNFKIENSSVKEETKLKSLVPDIGNLNPKFNPNIFEYDIDVSSDVSNINFQAEPYVENAKIAINRKKLAKAGETTTVKIKVSGLKRGISNTYYVNVHRNSKTNASNESHRSKSENKSSHSKQPSTKTNYKNHKFSSPKDNIEEYEGSQENDEDITTVIETNKGKNNNKLFGFLSLIALFGAGLAYIIYDILKNKKQNKK